MKLNPLRLCILLFLLNLNNSFVRAQSFVWAKSFSCENSDETSSTVTDAAGNAYFSGSFYCPSVNIGGVGLNSPSGNNSYLAKYSTTGTLLWVKFGINTGYYPRCLALDDQANIYCVGTFSSHFIKFGNDSLPNTTGTSGNTNFYIVKYDSSGNYLWAENFGGNRDDAMEALTTDNFGNIYLTGILHSDSLDLGSLMVQNPGLNLQSPVVIKFDSNGRALWARPMRPSNIFPSNSYSISSDANANVYVTGYFIADTLYVGDDTLVNTSYNTHTINLFVAKFDSAGNPQWARQAGSQTGISYAVGTSIVTDASANIYVGGSFMYTTHFDTISITSSGQSDFFVAKYDSSGTLLWVKGKGSNDNDEITGLALDSRGNCFATGIYKNIFPFASTYISNASPGYFDFFVLEYSPNGTEMMGAEAGGLADDYSYSIALDSAGNVFLAGYYESFYIQLGSTILVNTNQTTNFIGEAIMAKFSYPAVGMSENNSTGILVNLAPNPVQESLQFNLNLPSASDITLQLMNSFGQLLFEKHISKQAAGEYTEAIDTGTLSSGIYFVNVSTGNGRWTRRIVKM